MKTLALIAAVVLAMASPTKPYDGWSITISDTWVNSNRVRVIDAASSVNGRNHLLSFMCNETVESCVAPQVGQLYIISGSVAGYYSCDEYKLGRSHEDQILVCLLSVE